MNQLLERIFSINEFAKGRFNDLITGALIRSSSIWTLILIFCCLILTTVISYRATIGLIEDNYWVNHTQEVIEETLSVSANFRSAESRQRGYILTGDPRYLQNYYGSLDATNEHLKNLKMMVADNPLRSQEIEKLHQLVIRRTAIMQSVLDTYIAKGAEEGRKKLLFGGGLNVMNEFTQSVEKIESSEKKLLKERSYTSAGSRKYALRGLIIGAIFTTTLVFFSYYLLANDLRRRQKIAQELAQARDCLEDKVAERTQELERSNRELQEFAYLASHDLQEPLRKIQLFGDRLKNKTSGKLDETALDYLDRMQNAAQRMQSLIKDLLAFSRVSANKNPDNYKVVDLNILIQEVLADLEGSLEYYRGYICINTLPVIKADALQIRQLLQNIISNALKFHRPGVLPEISIEWLNPTSVKTAKTHGNYFEISIMDNGIGIDPQYIDKIFVPFQRLHGKNEYEGTGIGLAVCRKIIERHQGYIHVLPAPSGQGTAFVMGFPVI